MSTLIIIIVMIGMALLGIFMLMFMPQILEMLQGGI